MNEYFIYPGIGKIVLVSKNVFYKELQDKLVKLESEELKLIDRLFNNYSEFLLSKFLMDLLDSNSKLAKFNNDTFRYMLEFIEDLIPEKYRDTFYENLKTLEIESGIEYVPLNEEESKNKLNMGGYCINYNRLVIYKHTIDGLTEYAKSCENPDEVFGREINRLFFHELLHMASSSFDKETGVITSGFGDSVSLMNRGLTEGFTELLSMISIPGTLEINSFYYPFILLSKQLVYLVGMDVMMKSYFGTHDTRLIEKELNKIENNEGFSFGLLSNIESSFMIKENLGDVKQTFMGSAQNLMVYYFEQKMIKAIEERSISKKEVEELITDFENSLIAPEILSLNKLNSENYVGIDKSLNAFRSSKEYILSLLNEAQLKG